MQWRMWGQPDEFQATEDDASVLGAPCRLVVSQECEDECVAAQLVEEMATAIAKHRGPYTLPMVRLFLSECFCHAREAGCLADDSRHLLICPLVENGIPSNGLERGEALSRIPLPTLCLCLRACNYHVGS